MAYLNDKGIVLIGDIITLGYLKTKEGYTTNPAIHCSTYLDTNTNVFSEVFYTVNAFSHRDKYFHRSEHKTYQSALAAYNEIMKLHHKE